jgi:hypothetical protein
MMVMVIRWRNNGMRVSTTAYQGYTYSAGVYRTIRIGRGISSSQHCFGVWALSPRGYHGE